MTSTYTAIAIWPRTLFLRSNNGVVATRYAKNLSLFIAIVQIRCLALWLKIS